MKIKVFLADDHAIVIDGLDVLLSSDPDIDVVGFSKNGRDALKKIGKLAPDIAVMDIAMPELNGIEVTAKVSKICPKVRVIILSMHDTNEHVFQALRAGAKGYLVKESAGREVIEAVKKVHSGAFYFSRRIEQGVINEYIDHHKVIADSPLERLSSREREILQLVVEGKSSAQIGKILFISPKTVDTYRSRLMHKLKIKNLPSLVKFAIQHGLTSIET